MSSVLWLNGHVPKIPELPREEILRRAKLLKPLMMVSTYDVFPDKPREEIAFPEWPQYMVEPDPFNHAYTWTPVKDESAPKIRSLREVARIETFHTCGYIAFFKPTIEEVLAQTPEHLLYEANAYTTLKGDCVGCYSQGDGHRSVTVFYSLEELKDEEQTPYHDDSWAAMQYSREMMGKA